MKKFYVGVKGIIRTEQGYLLLRHAKGHYDTPGGRMDGYETFEQTIKRELDEELPGITDVEIGEMVGSYRLQKDIDGDIGLVLLYFLVNAKLPSPIQLSDEHQSYQWILTTSDIPKNLNAEIDGVLRKLLSNQ